MKKKLRELFLDYFNNFLSVEGFSEYYGLDQDKAKRIIELGRKLHEKHVSDQRDRTLALKALKTYNPSKETLFTYEQMSTKELVELSDKKFYAFCDSFKD
jgi:hypothetical protein